MKTLLVISDTHGNVSALEKIKTVMAESDYVFFLGDGALDILKYRDLLKGKLYAVDGNCDGCVFGKKEGVLTIENHRIFYTHGDLYSVKRSLLKLELEAKEKNADVVLYGHTHDAKEEVADGITFVNPGTTSRFSSEHSYAYICLTEKKIVTTIVKI